MNDHVPITRTRSTTKTIVVRCSLVLIPSSATTIVVAITVFQSNLVVETPLTNNDSGENGLRVIGLKGMCYVNHQLKTVKKAVVIHSDYSRTNGGLQSAANSQVQITSLSPICRADLASCQAILQAYPWCRSLVDFVCFLCWFCDKHNVTQKVKVMFAILTCLWHYRMVFAKGRRCPCVFVADRNSAERAAYRYGFVQTASNLKLDNVRWLSRLTLCKLSRIVIPQRKHTVRDVTSCCCHVDPDFDCSGCVSLIQNGKTKLRAMRKEALYRGAFTLQLVKNGSVHFANGEEELTCKGCKKEFFVQIIHHDKCCTTPSLFIASYLLYIKRILSVCCLILFRHSDWLLLHYLLILDWLILHFGLFCNG
ncbi:hypothetical protein KXD40_009406 [Peronospora effusa]|nr:hypothetical protein KXD40_009406 [Peronospora effusa]